MERTMTMDVGMAKMELYGKFSSMPRNRNVASTMFKAGVIDTWGRGFKKIREGFEKAGIPMPRVENFCGGVQVTIERTKFMQMMDVGDNVGGDVGGLNTAKLTERQRKMREMMQRNPQISASEMSEVLSVTRRTIERDIAFMHKVGIIIREGNVKSGRWVLVQK